MPSEKIKKAAPKRDPKTGKFISSKKTKKPKSKQPTTSVRFRKNGKFAKQIDVLEFKGGNLRKDYIVLDRFDSIKDIVKQNHPPGISPEKVLETFAKLSGFQSTVLNVTFLYMPGYAIDDDDSDLFDETDAVFIGTGDKFITQITNWLMEGYIVKSFTVNDLPEGAFEPTNTHPIWAGDVIETVNGPISGTGYRSNSNTKKPKIDYRERKPKRKRNYKRERERRKIKDKELGRKRNKGNVKEQKKRARERKKKQREMTNE